MPKVLRCADVVGSCDFVEEAIPNKKSWSKPPNTLVRYIT